MNQEKESVRTALNKTSYEEKERRKLEKKRAKQEKYYMSSQWQLMGRKLIRHKLAVISFILLFLLYIGAIFGNFIAPQGLEDYSATYSNAPPSKIHFVHNGEFAGPFVYHYDITYDKFQNKTFVENTEQIYPIKFFAKGTPYKFLGLFKADPHLFGVDNSKLPAGKDPVNLMIFGADKLGRDIFSGILNRTVNRYIDVLFISNCDRRSFRLLRRSRGYSGTENY